MSSPNCSFLTCPQISQEAGQVVWYAHLFKNFPVLMHTVKGFSVVNEAELGAFYGILLLFLWSTDVDNLISGSSAFFKSSLYTWQFLFPILLKSSLKDFEHYLASMWSEWNCMVVWTFFGITLLWDWSENWPFLVLWPLLCFPNLPAYWMQHFNSIIF